jgi:hypothetical protein
MAAAIRRACPALFWSPLVAVSLLPYSPLAGNPPLAAALCYPFHGCRPPPHLRWPPAGSSMNALDKRDWIAFLFLFSRVFLQNSWTSL